MSVSANYKAIFPLISAERLGPYKAVFSPLTDQELYGTYLWAQHAAGSLYPIIQTFEVTLRNAIDTVARKRFGDYWWDSIAYNTPRNGTAFYQNIKKARDSLDKEWKKKEKIRLGISSGGLLPATSVCPVWTHDKIIAATEFSTWQFALNSDLAFSSTSSLGNSGNYLWPASLGKVFKRYNIIDTNPDTARTILIDHIDEIRLYRNRIFHHEAIWMKAPHVVNRINAIDSIRSKINLFEKLFDVINLHKKNILSDAGVFLNARRSCSVEELDLYLGKGASSISKRQKRTLRKTLSAADVRTITISYDGKLFGIYKLR